MLIFAVRVVWKKLL